MGKAGRPQPVCHVSFRSAMQILYRDLLDHNLGNRGNFRFAEIFRICFHGNLKLTIDFLDPDLLGLGSWSE